MRSVIFSILFIVTLNSNAQKTILSKEYGISLTVPNDVKKYETESKTVLGYESADQNLAVDIEIIKFSDQRKHWLTSQKTGAFELAKLFFLTDIEQGSYLPHIKNAYYVTAHEKTDNEDNFVYVVLAVNEKLKISYEITIYIYDDNISVGKEILKTFRLIN